MNIHIVDSAAVDTDILSSLSGNGIINAILAHRGITSDADRDFFIHGDISQVNDPRLMKDAEVAAKVIKKHIEAGNKICIYSDYDADGFGATIVAVQLLRKLGANVVYFSNDRKIGYGAKTVGVDQMLAKDPDIKLVITTDNGIVAFDAVSYMNDLGLEVVVTDQ